MEATNSIMKEIDAIESNLPRIKKDIDQFDEVIKRAEAGHCDATFLNEKYHTLIQGAKDISSHLKTLRRATNYSSNDLNFRTRVKNLHEQAMTQFSRVQSMGRKVQDITKNVNSSVISFTEQGPGGESGLGTGGEAMQKQVYAPQEFDDVTVREMHQLEDDIKQVNELFTTMAAYVQDQGDLVDSIEANVENTYQQVTSGNVQLAAAVRSKKAARRKKCILLSVFVGCLVVLILILVLALRKK